MRDNHAVPRIVANVTVSIQNGSVSVRAKVFNWLRKHIRFRLEITYLRREGPCRKSLRSTRRLAICR